MAVSKFKAAAFRGRELRAVLFDLDGTLLDTAADIAQALNRTFAERGWLPLPVSDVTRMIGRGSPMLIERAAAAGGYALGKDDHATLLERFFSHYRALEEDDKSESQPYGGVADALREVHAAGLRTAVVTNKHHEFATALLTRLELAAWVDTVVGGDTCERRKPDPQPLLFACETLGVMPQMALMVGDSVNDVTAARAAGIAVVCVPYGYNEGQDPRSLACDAMLDTLADLAPLIGLRSNRP